MYGPSTNGTSQSLVKAGLAGQLSAEQATLYRQATTISADALGTLAGLMPFIPEAELDKVEALRALVRAEFNTLVEEFGRINEPRSDRVKRYFDALVGPNGHLIQFGRHAFLDGTTVTPTTADDEAMLAGFELVRQHA
jgi:hypothetical protein